MVDDRHYNYWEQWLSKACQVEEFSSFNSLWLSYFIVGPAVPRPITHHVFRQVLQTVYTSLPDLNGVLFLSRKYLEPLLSIACLKVSVFTLKPRPLSLSGV